MNTPTALHAVSSTPRTISAAACAAHADLSVQRTAVRAAQATFNRDLALLAQQQLDDPDHTAQPACRISLFEDLLTSASAQMQCHMPHNSTDHVGHDLPSDSGSDASHTPELDFEAPQQRTLDDGSASVSSRRPAPIECSTPSSVVAHSNATTTSPTENAMPESEPAGALAEWAFVTGIGGPSKP